MWVEFLRCSSREHAEAIAFYRAGGTERELVTSRLQALLSSRSVLIWWQRNLEAFQLSYQCVVNARSALFPVSLQTSTSNMVFVLLCFAVVVSSFVLK